MQQNINKIQTNKKWKNCVINMLFNKKFIKMMKKMMKKIMINMKFRKNMIIFKNNNNNWQNNK